MTNSRCTASRMTIFAIRTTTFYSHSSFQVYENVTRDCSRDAHWNLILLSNWNLLSFDQHLPWSPLLDNHHFTLHFFKLNILRPYVLNNSMSSDSLTLLQMAGSLSHQNNTLFWRGIKQTLSFFTPCVCNLTLRLLPPRRYRVVRQ